MVVPADWVRRTRGALHAEETVCAKGTERARQAQRPRAEQQGAGGGKGPPGLQAVLRRPDSLGQETNLFSLPNGQEYFFLLRFTFAQTKSWE